LQQQYIIYNNIITHIRNQDYHRVIYYLYSLIAIGARTVVRIGEEYDDGVRYVVGKEMAGRPPFPSASMCGWDRWAWKK
jgi:hypothetical protein